MKTLTEPRALRDQFARPILGLGAVILLLLSAVNSVHAQSPVDALTKLGADTLNTLLTPCSTTKFIDCITLENNEGRVDGTLNRNVDGGTMVVDIKLRVALDTKTAQFSFKTDTDSYKATPTAAQNYLVESFNTDPGQPYSGALATSSLFNGDTTTGGGFGAIVCGMTNVRFNLLLYPPPGTSNPDAKALAASAHAQLKTMMLQVAPALLAAGACASSVPPKFHLAPIASAAPYTLFVGDTISVTGVVWAKDKDDLNHGPVQSKIRITGGGPDIDGTTDESGYFEINYPVLKITTTIVVEAISPDPKQYSDGEQQIRIETEEHGTLDITVATDKPIYKRGEPVTITGNVTQDGKAFPALLSVASDALPFPTSNVNADGSYTFTFIPGTEPDRSKIGPFLPGVHFVLVKAIYTGYATGFNSANYVVQSDIATSDNCTPIAVQVLKVTGPAHVLPLQEQDLQKQGILAGFALMNDKTTLAEGMNIQTTDSARVAIRFDFGNGSDAVVVLNGGTTLKIGRFCQDLDGKIHGVIAIDKIGQVAVNVVNANPDKGGLDFNITTPSASVKSVHTRYLVNVDAQGATTVAAFEGTVLVSDAQGANGIELPSSNLIQVNAGAAPKASDITALDGQLDPALESLLGSPNVAPATNLPATPPSANIATTPIAVTTSANSASTPAAATTGPNPLVLAGAAGAIVLLVLLSGVVILSRRGRPTTQPSAPVPQPISPPSTQITRNLPPARPAAPTTLPEQRIQSSDKPNPADVRRVEDSYFVYRGQRAAGRITQTQFEANLQELMIQDGQGRYWLMGADTGKWYVHDGQTWVQAEPT